MTLLPKRSIRSMAVLAAATLVVTAAACGSSGSSKVSSGGGSSAPKLATGNGSAALPPGMPGQGKPPVTLGDKNFSEEYILGDLYQQALQAKGYTVNLKPNLGSAEVTDKALTSGQIDLYPEYTGVIYTELANLGQQPQTADITYQGAKMFEAGRGFTILNPTPFQDADGVAVTKGYAQKNGLKAIGDLSKVGSFTYAGPAENATRYQGVVGLQKAYGLSKLQFVPLAIGSQYNALDQGKVNTIAIFTTDGELVSGKYAVLSDTKAIFGFQQVVPVVGNKVISAEGPEFSQILNAVSAKLTFPAIQAMNQAVQINQQNPATVAASFLKANGLG